ncbi:4-azaleucine resistance transporter AzlC [Bacillus oleivorans]|uniref:4-azaleucine resistance transporter AzlC n=1 Tax=Bacillus oleivorans TaxID=1448271 RepID=A0A285CR35_9BACI|nr:AzlC family ABC transporter permease [Bacillus oleivorans]SNX70040.1 4-azaleucine resistance transporter AzlC [Bacillus oleivorans]
MEESVYTKAGTAASLHFKQGLKAGTSIAIGYFPIAVAFGLIAKTTGLTLSETVFMSLFVYAGAAQYMSLSLIEEGIGMAEIVLTTFIVNIRHLLLSTSLNEKVEKDSVFKKAVYAFGVTDETFSVASITKEKLTTGFMYGLTIIAYLSWVISSGIGYIGGSLMPQFLQESMSVALYAMFIGLLVPSLKGNRKVMFLALVAAVFNTVITMSDVMSSGWAIVASTLASAILIEWVEWIRNRGVVQHD